MLKVARSQGVSTLKYQDIEASLYPVIPGKSLVQKKETAEERQVRKDAILFHSAK
jgi:hypothetical protein